MIGLLGLVDHLCSQMLKLAGQHAWAWVQLTLHIGHLPKTKIAIASSLMLVEEMVLAP